MSQDFNHIDDLFENLNRFEGNPEEQDWQAILRKMQQETLPVDTAFAKGFDGFEGAPSEADWSAIRAKMDKRKRRVLAWYILLPLVLLLAGFGSWYGLSDKNNSLAIHSAVVTEQTEIKNSDKQSEQTQTGSANNGITSADAKVNVAEPTVSATDKNNSINSNTQPSQTAGKSNKTTAEPKQAKAKTPVAKQAPVASPKTSAAVMLASEIDNNPEFTTDKAVTEKTVKGETPEVTQAEEELPIPASDVPVPETTPVVLNTDSLKPKSATTGNGNPLPATGKWRLGLNAGVNNTFRTLSGTGGLYDSVRRNQESARILPSFGLSLDYALNTHWNVGTGVQYNQYGQTANYSYKRMIYDSFPHLDPQGHIMGWFRFNYRDTVQNSSEQLVYRYVSVPVSAQYRFKLNSKFTGLAGLAANVNIFAGAKGRVIQMEQLMGVDDIDKMRSKLRGITMSVLLSAGIEYKLNARTSIGLNLNYMQGAQSYFKQTYPVKEKPNSIGLNASLIFQLPSRNIAKSPVVTP